MKIFCVGRNYADHAKELNNAIPESPVIFMKPPTALTKGNKPIFYPDFTNDLHYEAEIVLKVAKNGKNVQEKFAHKYYDALTLGIDFTARDIQAQQKQKGLPWEIAKAFDGSAPIGKFINKDDLDLETLEFELFKNGTQVQKGHVADMLFSFDKIIIYISRFFTLQRGDLIFTGTPAGVGPTVIGDELIGTLNGEQTLRCRVK